MGELTNKITELETKFRNLELEKKVKEKKWKFPFGKKVSRGQKLKNYVTTLIINENGNYHFQKYQIEDQTIIHDLIPRLATAGYVMHDKKGNPLIILPNWSIEPFSPLEHYQKSLINGSNSAGFKIILAKMLSNVVENKKKMSGWIKWIVGLIGAAVVIYAIVTTGGK